MSSRDLLLALDVGTQSSRAVLHDRLGAELSIGQAKHAPLKSPYSGAVTQDPQDVLEAICRASRECMEGHDVERIAAVSLTSQRSAVIPTKADGEPLADAISWLDTRSAHNTPLLSSVPSGLLRMLPDTNLLVMFAGWSRANIFSEWDPEVFEKAQKWLTLSGWLTHWMTGRFVDAAGAIAGVWPFEAKTSSWMGPGFVRNMLGFREGTLPDLVPAMAELGKLRAEAAEAMGLMAGMPLIAVGGDKQSEVLGGGVPAADRSLGAVSLGTAASVMMPETRCKKSPTYRYLTNVAAEPNAWIREVMVMRGFWMVSWFVREFADQERRMAAESGGSAEGILSERALTEVPPGANGLMLLPRFTPMPDVPNDRGVLLGLTDQHDRLAIFRAMIEGIALDLKRGLLLLERTGGRKMRALRVGGGGSRSDLVVRTCASVLNRPLEQGATHELSALGASICAAVSLGWYPDTQAAVANMTRVAERIEPDPELARFYEGQYRKAFLPALRRVRPLTGWLRHHRYERGDG